MNETLFPLGLLLFIGLFAFAMIHTGRKQRREKREAFRAFAGRNGFRYREEDDRSARIFAGDFDGIGQFRTSSIGKVIPQDVVTGRVNGSEVIAFRHYTRYSEGWARQWFVVGLTSTRSMARRCTVQFCKKNAHKRDMHLPDPVVKEARIAPFHIMVRAPDPASAGRLTEDGVLTRLANLAAALSFRPEIQIRDTRIIGYLADRNADEPDDAGLEELFDFTKNVMESL